MQTTRILASGVALLVAGCDPGPAPVTSTLVINEVLFREDPGSAEAERAHEWVEIHNAGQQDQRLVGWTIADRAATLLALPDVVIPPGAYLVVHFAGGTDDVDLSDGMGDFHSQNTGSVLADDQDEVGLFSGAPAVGTMVDFVNWKVDTASFDGGQSYQHALAAGEWTADTFFDASNAAANPWERRRTTRPGDSIGRDASSTDTDVPEDWDITGGADARENTPRRQNHSPWHLVARPGPPPDPLADWTFMVYSDGDNDLEQALFNDLTEMEQAPDSQRVNIVVMVDGYEHITEVEEQAGRYVPKPGRSPGRTWRGRIRHDTDPEHVFLHLTDDDLANDTYYMDEQNMGAPGTLAGFVAWATANYPAKRYALVLEDHGSGWKGVCVDDTSAEDWIRIGELQQGLAGVSVDLIGFDACLMGMIEVAEQVKGAAAVMVASEETEDCSGWPYDTVLTDLVRRPTMDGRALGEVIVDRYHEYYQRPGRNRDPRHTLAAIDLGAGFDTLVKQVSAFGAEMTVGIEDVDAHGDPTDNEQLDIRDARENTEEYDDPNYVDLYDLAAWIDARNLEPQYKTQAPRITRSLVEGGPVIVAEAHGDDHAQSHGLSIYFPRLQDRPGQGEPFDEPSTNQDAPGSPAVVYARDLSTDWGAVPYFGPPVHPRPQAQPFGFPAGTEWDEFLHRYYKPVADAGEDVIALWGSQVTLAGTGSSDSDGRITRHLWDEHSGRDEPPGIGPGPCGSSDEDAECDLIDELDDDAEFEGETGWIDCLEPVFEITLSVHDDHHQQAGHSNHWKTDQDAVTVLCLPCTKEARWRDGDLVYTLAVVNVAEQGREIRLTDQLPAKTRVLSVAPEGTLELDEDERVLTGTVALEPGETASFEVVLAPEGWEPGVYVTNELVVDDGVGPPASCEATAALPAPAVE